MMLESARPSAVDIEIWASRARADPLHARSLAFRRRLDRALQEASSFLAEGPAYVAVSWGKDSVCLAHMIYTLSPETPLIWFCGGILETPECYTVRDVFLSAHPARYFELADDGAGDPDAWTTRTDSRRITGIRGEESKWRALSASRHGHSTARSCRPLLRWLADDVFAYLAHHDLPIHPAYACSFGGILERGRIRVGPLGGSLGAGVGRREWEWRYYRDEILRIQRSNGNG
jgi:phosphoadenosine phosphosulfate reductase